MTARSFPARSLTFATLLLATTALTGCSGELPMLGGRHTSALTGDNASDAGKAEAIAGSNMSDADKAVAYWADAYARNQRDERATIGYARALKAAGEKEKALNMLQQAAINNPDLRPIASEQGRIALDLGQLDYAEKALARADDPTKPDWKVASARGTLAAKRGDRKSAITLFEQAQTLAPAEPSVLNNLALAYALDGRPAEAETLLKGAAGKGGDITKIRQNLALVLGVQGKFEEAKQVASNDLAKEQANANVAYLEKMVKATPVKLAGAKLAPAASAAVADAGTWATTAEPALAWESKVAVAK